MLFKGKYSLEIPRENGSGVGRSPLSGASGFSEAARSKPGPERRGLVGVSCEEIKESDAHHFEMCEG